MAGERFEAEDIVNNVRQADVDFAPGEYGGRYGSLRITGVLRDEGWNANHERAHG